MSIIFTVQNLVCLSATVHELSPQNKMLILNINRQPCSYFSFLTKMFFLKAADPLKIYHNTKFHGYTLSAAIFAFTSEVWTPAILKWLQLQH
jgi:hypothetical protein